MEPLILQADSEDAGKRLDAWLAEQTELTRSAAQGKPYAQYFLNHQDDFQTASVGNAVSRMLHHMSRIFRENMAAGDAYTGLQIDRKRRRKLQQKRIAMGHKADDHEEQLQHQPNL